MLYCTVLHILFDTVPNYTVSLIGRDKGYTVKYNPLLKEFPRAKPEGIPEGEGLYLTVYPKSSPNTDIISF